MSLRMNLFGWSLDSFMQVLGSKDGAVLEAALGHLDAAQGNEKEAWLARCRAWLRTLIESGYPLRKNRPAATEPEDGGLLVMQMETELHAYVVYCIGQAIARPDHLDLSGDSSGWSHPAISALYNDLSACGFTKVTKDHPMPWFMDYFRCMQALENGTPLFGDAFRTQWSYYTIFTNRELGTIISIFDEAIKFRRRLPESIPEEARVHYRTSLSDEGKGLAKDLIEWFPRIQQSGQDAFIYWW